MKPIKVVYFYSSVRLDTGSPRALLQMVDSLDRARFQPIFIVASDGDLTSAMRDRKVEIIQSNVTSVSWKNPIRLIGAVRTKMRLLKTIGADILHMNEPGWNSDIVLAAHIARIPVALHLHNPCEITRKNLNLTIASRILICSAAQRQVIVNFGRIKDKCTVLHNAVDIDAFAHGHSIRESIGLKADDIVVGTVAQIRHGKGIDLFLDAAERLLDGTRKLKFVIVGPQAANESEYFSAVMKRLAQGRLKGNVIYLGSRSDIPDLFASFDVFLLATRAETFGIVVIEAMAAGVPVVASSVGGVPEIITGHDIGRKVGSLTPDAFATAVDELLHMGAKRKELGERGRASLPGRFDLAHMGQTLSKVYDEMLS